MPGLEGNGRAKRVFSVSIYKWNEEVKWDRTCNRGSRRIHGPAPWGCGLVRWGGPLGHVDGGDEGGVTVQKEKKNPAAAFVGAMFDGTANHGCVRCDW